MNRSVPPIDAAPTPRTRGRGGFTFLEILVVMGMMAVLLGLGIGFIFGVGKKAIAMQAASILSESGSRCQNMSAGGKRATLDLRKVQVDGNDRLVVMTSVARTILTANFSMAPREQPGAEWYVNAAGGPDLARPSGNVSIDADGQSGGAAKFAGGNASVDFGSRSGFAMTDGVDIEFWVRPDGGRGTSTLLKCDSDGQALWKLELERLAAGTEAYRLVFTCYLVPSTASEGTNPVPFRFGTTPAVHAGTGKFTHVQASYDGREPSIRVDGVERYVPDVRGSRNTTAESIATWKFPTPPSAVARIVLSDPARPFSGLVDTLTVGGVFRTDEDVRMLPMDVTVVGRSLPLRVPFVNGRVDPSDPIARAGDVIVHLASPADVDSGGLYEIRFGRYGSMPPPRRVLAPGGIPPGSGPVTSGAAAPAMNGDGTAAPAAAGMESGK